MLDHFQKQDGSPDSSMDVSSPEKDISLEDTRVEIPVTPPLESTDVPVGRTTFASLNAIIETGLIVVGLIALVFLLYRNTGGDGWIRYQGLLQIVIHHSFPTMKYSLIGPSFALPLVWIGRKMHNPYGWVTIYNQILFILTLFLGYLILRKHMDRALLRKFYLMLIVASMFVANVAWFYGEVFTALCVGFGVLIAYIRFTRIPGWLLVALGVANTPAALGGLALLLLKRMWDDKRLRYALIFLLALAFMGLNNWLLRGNPLNAAYDNDHGPKSVMPYSGLPGFSYPFFFGLLSLLLSFGKGLLFFAPGLLLPVRKTLLRGQRANGVPLYQVYTLWIAFVVGLLLVYSRWWAWYGGQFWGPRFLLFASIPASFALAVRLIHHKEASLGVNLLTLAAFVLSVWVCIDGAIYQWHVIAAPICVLNHSNLESLCYYTPDYSELWLPFVTHYALTINQEIFMGYLILAALYLIVPLCIHLARQLYASGQKYIMPHVSLKAWKI